MTQRALASWIAFVLAAAVATAQQADVTLQGRVVDVFGEPVPAATITVRDLREAAPRATATSDGEGLWQVPRLPGDAAFVVEARANGKVPGRVTGLRNPDSAVWTCNFELQDGVPLRGVVRADGAPVADAAVFVRSREFQAAVRTDAEGRYAFAAVPLLGAVLVAASEGRIGDEVPIDGREQRAVACDVVLAGPPIGRRRLLVEGVPAELRARCWFEVSVRPEVGMLQLPLGGDDGVALEAWPFAHEIVLHVPGRAVTPPFVRCPAGSTADLALRVEAAVEAPSTTLAGTVRDGEGAAVAGAEVVVAAARDGARLAAVTTDAAGGFVVEIARARGAMLLLRAIEPGRMLVADGSVTLGFEPIALAAGPSAAVSGRLLDARGDALAFAEVEVRVARSIEGSARQHARTATDRAGRFVVRGLALGAATIAATDARGNRGVAAVRLVRGETADVPALAYSAGATIGGRIVDARGLGVPGLRVHATLRSRAGRPVLSSATCYTDRDGRYRLRGLAPGDQALQVLDLDGNTGLATAQVRVAAGEVAEQGFAVAPGGR